MQLTLTTTTEIKTAVLADAQHGGFRKKRPRETQLLVSIRGIANNLAKGDQVDVVLDFSNAFDRVGPTTDTDNSVLHKLKLHYYGVRNNTP